MKVSIIGSGDVGKALALGFLKHNYEVMIGTEHKDKLLDWEKKTGFSGKFGSFLEASEFGEIIVLAVKGSVAKDVIRSINGKISGKVIIDVTNPIAELPPENGVLRFFTSLDRSLMEDLQTLAPQAKFVKAFNSVGNAFMVNPDFAGTKPTMFICGNNSEAKEKVSKIVNLFGFDSEDMGGAEGARAIEPLCMLWCIPGFLRHEWSHAFKLLKK